jgi:hypothetical protein
MYEYLWTTPANADSADVHAVYIRERFSAVFDFEERRPGATGPAGCTGPPGDAATSTAPARPASAGTPTPRQRHDHNEL